MNYLLDTHTLIWAITAPQKLSKTAKDLIESPEQHIIVSAITFWEISLKYSIGKLALENISPEDFPNICHEMDLEVLPLDPETCATYHNLRAKHHKDPFDRMLIWLAKTQDFALVSKDESVRLYESEGISVVW